MKTKIIDTLLSAVKDLHEVVTEIRNVLEQEQRRTGGPMIVCTFCRGSGELKLDNLLQKPCPYCGGVGNIDRNIQNPTLKIQTWKLIGLEGKDLGHGVTIEVLHMDPDNKQGVLWMLEKAVDLVEQDKMIKSETQVH
jgi:hypothetical protein